MTDPLRVCCYDSVNGNETPLRAAFEPVPNIILLGSASNWKELSDWLRHGAPDVIAVNLDGHDEVELDIVHRAAAMAPNCGIIGFSRRTDASSIIAAMRAGCSQFVCWPVDQQDLANAVQRIRAARMAATHTSKRICVIGASGGAGATTIACNLAMELAHISNRRCALVDMNLEFGDVACAFDCTPRFSVADACREGVEIDRVLLGKALHELPCNVSILARPDRLEDVHLVSSEGVRAMVRVLGEMFPFVLLDLPRSFTPLSIAAVRDSDHVLIVTQLGVPFIRNATRVYESLREAKIADSSIEIVLNRCKSIYERITPDDVEAHFGKPVFAMIPNDYRRVQTALDLGHPIVADAPNTPARLAIEQMARKIAGETALDTDPVAMGLFSRFWARSRRDKAESATA